MPGQWSSPEARGIQGKSSTDSFVVDTDRLDRYFSRSQRHASREFENSILLTELSYKSTASLGVLFTKLGYYYVLALPSYSTVLHVVPAPYWCRHSHRLATGPILISFYDMTSTLSVPCIEATSL